MSSNIGELSSWVNSFKDQLVKSSYDLIVERLSVNQFTTRTQLKLLFRNEIELMFSEGELPLGAKALLLYELEKLRNESPLPLHRSQRRNSTATTTGQLDKNNGSDHVSLPTLESEKSAPVARKGVLPAFQSQKEKLVAQLKHEQDEYSEINLKLESMAVQVPEQPAIGNSKLVCSNCHARGHRNNYSRPCVLSKCTDYTFCGIRDKHPEYNARLNSLKSDLRRKGNTIKELEAQIKSMEDFSNSNEYHFIKSLAPRLYKVDTSYKINKPKLMRDCRILRQCLDGEIPEVTANDAEQLGILLSKCRKNVLGRADAANISTDKKGAFEEGCSPIKTFDFPKITSTNTTRDDGARKSLEGSDSSDGIHEKRKKKRSKTRKHKRKRKQRRESYSSDEESDSDSHVKYPHKKDFYFNPFIPSNPNLPPSYGGFISHRMQQPSAFAGHSGYYPAMPTNPFNRFNTFPGYFPAPQYVVPPTGQTLDDNAESPDAFSSVQNYFPGVSRNTNGATATVNTNNNITCNMWSGLETLVDAANETAPKDENMPY